MAAVKKSDKEQPLIDDIRLLGRILGDVIREQEGAAAFELVEQIRKLSVAFRRDADAEADKALKKLLKDAGVPDDAVAELETAMAEDQEESKGRGKLGARVKAWLGTLLVKAGSGTWHVALETASSLIPAAIAGYLGISLG